MHASTLAGNQVAAGPPRRSASSRAARLAGGGPRVGHAGLPYAFIVPAACFLALFAIFPFLWALLISLQPSRSAARASITDFTLKNFEYVLTDPRTLDSLRVTLIYAVLTTVLCIAFSILTALALRTVRRGAGVYQAFLLIPLTLAPPVVIILWRALFDPTSGAIDGVLTKIGLPTQGFYESSGQALYVLVAMAVWSNVGFWSLVFSSALNMISPEVYEAAGIDGCGPMRKFWYVIFPLLKRTTLLASVVLSSASLVVFIPAQLLTQGGPGDSTNFLMYLAAENVLRFGRPGPADALVVLLLAIIAITVIVQFRVIRSSDE